VKAYEAEHGRFDVIVVDTVARALQGNENSPEDMSAFVDACERLVGNSERTVIAVHHFGKDESRGARGHTALPAAVATQINVEADAIGRKFYVEFQRDEEPGEPHHFRLERVPFALDEDGDELASVVVVPVAPAEIAERRPPPKPQGANRQLALRVFREITEGLTDDPRVREVVGKRMVPYEVLLAAVRAAAPDRDPRGNLKQSLDNMLKEGAFLSVFEEETGNLVYDVYA
jgi:hypothetical protein